MTRAERIEEAARALLSRLNDDAGGPTGMETYRAEESLRAALSAPREDAHAAADFLATVDNDGIIVGTSGLSEQEIALARAGSRMYVAPNGRGYVKIAWSGKPTQAPREDAHAPGEGGPCANCGTPFAASANDIVWDSQRHNTGVAACRICDFPALVEIDEDAHARCERYPCLCGRFVLAGFGGSYESIDGMVHGPKECAFPLDAPAPETGWHDADCGMRCGDRCSCRGGSVAPSPSGVCACGHIRSAHAWQKGGTVRGACCSHECGCEAFAPSPKGCERCGGAGRVGRSVGGMLAPLCPDCAPREDAHAPAMQVCPGCQGVFPVGGSHSCPTHSFGGAARCKDPDNCGGAWLCPACDLGPPRGEDAHAPVSLWCPQGCEGIEIQPGEFSGCACRGGNGCDCPNHPGDKSGDAHAPGGWPVAPATRAELLERFPHKSGRCPKCGALTMDYPNAPGVLYCQGKCGDSGPHMDPGAGTGVKP